MADYYCVTELWEKKILKPIIILCDFIKLFFQKARKTVISSNLPTLGTRSHTGFVHEALLKPTEIIAIKKAHHQVLYLLFLVQSNWES